VTGGGFGIGKALCLALGNQQSTVIAADLNLEAAQRTRDDLLGMGCRCESESLDIREESSFRRVLDRVLERHGRIDYLFNVAGVSSVCEIRDLPQSQWRNVIETNLIGTIHGSTLAYERMLEQGWGHIVNVSSAAGFIPQPVTAVYTATKHAINGFTACLQAEAAALGVDVTLVCPGYVRTNLFEACEIVAVERNALLSAVPFSPMDAGAAATAILKGVAQRKALIVFPFHARLTALVARLFPTLIGRLLQSSLRNLRLARNEGGK
jgi:NAD(P)-dependent dehydrogenase (short-subunit alcohol dehydrogenase family)